MQEACFFSATAGLMLMHHKGEMGPVEPALQSSLPSAAHLLVATCVQTNEWLAEADASRSSQALACMHAVPALYQS